MFRSARITAVFALATMSALLPSPAMLRAQAPGSAQALYDVAKVSFAKGDYKASRNACRDLAKAHPDDVLSLVCEGRAFLVWRRASRALEPIEIALGREPNHVEALLALADAKRMEGNTDESLAAYQKVASSDTHNAAALLGMGQLYLSMGKPSEAITALRAALAADPDMVTAQLELGRLLEGGEAVALLSKAVAALPNDQEAKLALAKAQLSVGDAAAATPVLLELVKRNPADGRMHVALGIAWLAAQDWTKAEAEIRAGMKTLPNDPDGALALARILAKTDRVDDAFEQYRGAASLRPGDIVPLMEAAELAIGLSRNVLACAFLDKALERMPNAARAHQLYGDALLARGDRAGAKDHYTRALNGQGAVDRAQINARLAQLK